MNDDALAAQRAAAHELLEIIPLVMRTLAAELRRSGQLLMPAHMATLALLEERAFNLSELAERLVVSRPTVSNLISNLQQRGWVRRVRAQHDRRVVMVELTAGGRETLDEISRDAEQNIAGHLAQLSISECKELRVGLTLLRAAFQQAYTDPPQGEA